MEFVTNQSFASPYGYQFPPRTQRPDVTGYDEQMLVDIDQERSRIFCTALRPLFRALDSGVLSALGQQDPVHEPDQPKEAVPYVVFDNGNWYLTREKSRLHVKGSRHTIIESDQASRHVPGVVATYRWTELRLRTATNKVAAGAAGLMAQASTEGSPKDARVSPVSARVHLDEVVRSVYERSSAPKPGLVKVWATVKQTSGHERVPRDRVKAALDKIRRPVPGRPKKRKEMSEETREK
jgi:hypothetical protein